MKRFMVLVLCLALAFTAVSAQAVSLAKVVGRWYFISVDGAGLVGDSYVEFNRDKTVALIVAGQAKDMTGLEWKVSDDTIRISKGGALSAYSLDYADDILTLRTRELSELSGSTLRNAEYKLSRTAATFYTPALINAAAEEEFFGDFALYLVKQNGQYTQMNTEGNGYDIAEFVAVVNSEGQAGQEYLTNFVDGKLVIYGPTDVMVSRTEDPDVIATYDANAPENIAYLRRKGTSAPGAVPTVVPEAPVVPAATEAPAVPEPTKAPSNPVFPGMIKMTPAPKAPAADTASVSAYYGSYIVYQDKLANGNVLDMSSRGLKAVIDADGVHVTAYGQKLNVPYQYENGVMSANISAVSPSYGIATASLADNGELVVTLSDAAGNVGETLYLRQAK